MNRMFTPEQIAPMACAEVDSVDQLPGDPDDYALEIKFDGFRLLACVFDDHVDFMTRGSKWQDGKLPYIEAELLKVFPSGTVLDGEIVALRSATAEEIADGKPGLINDFEHVQSIMLSKPDEALLKARLVRPLRYMVFDMLHFYGEDMTGQSWLMRRTRLSTLMAGDEINTDLVQLSPTVEAVQENHDAWVAAGCEGTVAKLKSSRYHVGKRPKGAWYKLKATWTMDAIIVGFVPGRGKNKGKVGSIVFAQPTNDANHHVNSVAEATKLNKMYASELAKGKTSTGMYWGHANPIFEGLDRMVIRGCARGFNDQIMDDMTANRDSYIGRVVEISHNGLMAGGTKVRHPQLLRFRPDKTAADVDWRHR